MVPPASKKKRSLKDLQEAPVPASSGGHVAMGQLGRGLSEAAGIEAADAAAAHSAPTAVPAPYTQGLAAAPSLTAVPPPVADASAPDGMETSEPCPAAPLEEEQLTGAKKQDSSMRQDLPVPVVKEIEETAAAETAPLPLKASPAKGRENADSVQINASRTQLKAAAPAHCAAPQQALKPEACQFGIEPLAAEASSRGPELTHHAGVSAEGPLVVPEHDSGAKETTTVEAQPSSTTSEAVRPGQPEAQLKQHSCPGHMQPATGEAAMQPNDASAAAAPAAAAAPSPAAAAPSPAAAVPVAAVEEQSEERRQSGSLASSSAPSPAGHDAGPAAQPVELAAKASLGPPNAKAAANPQPRLAAFPEARPASSPAATPPSAAVKLSSQPTDEQPVVRPAKALPSPRKPAAAAISQPRPAASPEDRLATSPAARAPSTAVPPSSQPTHGQPKMHTATASLSPPKPIARATPHHGPNAAPAPRPARAPMYTSSTATAVLPSNRLAGANSPAEGPPPGTSPVTPRTGLSPGIASFGRTASRGAPASRQPTQAEAAARPAAAAGKPPAVSVLAEMILHWKNSSDAKVTKLDTPQPSKLSPVYIPAPRQSAKPRSALDTRPSRSPDSERIVLEEATGSPRRSASPVIKAEADNDQEEGSEQKEAARRQAAQNMYVDSVMKKVCHLPTKHMSDKYVQL